MFRNNQSSACNEAGPNTLFLGSLAPETTECDIIEYISQFGRVSNAKIIRDAVTSISKNCGLAFCDDEDTCYNVLAESVHVIRHKHVRIGWADKNKKGTKRIHSSIIHVESVDPVLHVSTIVDYFSQFGEISRSEVLRGYSGKASKKRSPCLIKIQYQSSWSVSEATKFQGEHFIRGIRVQCYVVFEPEGSCKPTESSQRQLSKQASHPSNQQVQVPKVQYLNQDNQYSDIQFLDYTYQESQRIPTRPSQIRLEACNSEYISDPKDHDELSMLEEDEESYAGGKQSFHGGSPPSKNRSLFESRSTMRESRTVSEVFGDDFENFAIEHQQSVPSGHLQQRKWLPEFQGGLSSTGQDEEKRGIARSLEWKGDPTLGYAPVNRETGKRTYHGLVTVSEKDVLLPTQAEVAPLPTKFHHSERSKIPEFIPQELGLNCNLTTQDADTSPQISRSQVIRSDSKLLLVEFEKDEIFAVFFKDLKIIADEETKYIKGLIRRGELC